MEKLKKRPVMLAILDGWGVSAKKEGNAVAAAKTPFLDNLFLNYPHTLIKTSGEAVGLPQGQMGNSEVGHTNIGAGRIVYQDLLRINRAVASGDIEKNQVLREAMLQSRENGKALHLGGLLSDGGVHSHIDHLVALLQMAKKLGLNKVFVHAFFDGRDTPPESGVSYLRKLQSKIQEIGVGEVATLAGRYYAMDRDNRWERVKLAYDVITGDNSASPCVEDAVSYLEKSYASGITDEFIVPARVLCHEGSGSLQAGDSFIYFNFRPDRARELTRALLQDVFTGFPRRNGSLDLHYVTMTEYDRDFYNFKGLKVAYEPYDLHDTLGEVISENGYRQLRIAETEKYAHVTFFLNGGREEPYKLEDRILVPSPKVATYDLKPEMSAREVTERLLEVLQKDLYDFIIVNFANCDMVGHTGIFAAAVKAVETVDSCLSQIVPLVLAKEGVVLITADHGNSEQMIDEKTGGPFTAHTTNDVPFLVVGMGDVKLKDDKKLCDIAPTILQVAGLKKPEAMTGESIIA